MNINKLDLLSKGWKTTEIEHASRILEEAEKNKKTRIPMVDAILFSILGIVMLANALVCSALLAPYIYVKELNFIMLLAVSIGIIFSAIFTLLIFEIERMHNKSDTRLFIAFIINGLINFYLILEFTARFGVFKGLNPTNNIYLISGVYLMSYILPQLVYQIRKKRWT